MRKEKIQKSKKKLSKLKNLPTKQIVSVNIPIYIKLTIYVDNLNLQEEVENELLRIFRSEIFLEKTKGQSLRQSEFVKTIMKVNGVISVTVNSFVHVKNQKNHEPSNHIIKLEPNEFSRLEKNPAQPEQGRIEFYLQTK